MRPPRRGFRHSPARGIARLRYAAYVESPEWRARRRRWVVEWHVRNPADELCCTLCGRPWDEHRDDLHHLIYARLTCELFTDLLPLCRSCHEAFHTQDGE